MKHPSEDYDVTTCRFQKGSREHEALIDVHICASDWIMPMKTLSLCGLVQMIVRPPDRSELHRDGECVAQWAVIR